MPVAEFLGRSNGDGETGIEVLEDAILVTKTAVCSWRGGGFCGERAEGMVESAWMDETIETRL